MRIVDFINRGVLNIDEKVVWSGRPSPKESALYNIEDLIGFYCFFTIFIMYIIFSGESSNEIKALAGGLLLVVLGSLFGIHLRRYLRALRTYYFITNCRVIILEDRTSYKITDIRAGEMQDYLRADKKHGCGNLRFRSIKVSTNLGWATSVRYIDGLWGIEDLDGAANAVWALRGG